MGSINYIDDIKLTSSDSGSSFYVNPIRGPESTANALFYNTSSKEITYSSAITGPTGYTGYTGYTGPTGPTGSFSFTGPSGAVLFYNGTSVTGSSNLTYNSNQIFISNGISTTQVGPASISSNEITALSGLFVSAGGIDVNGGIDMNFGDIINTNSITMSVGNIGINYDNNIKLTSTGLASSVAIGYQAGQTNQGTYSVAIGPSAGQNIQTDQSVAIGYQAGQNNQGPNSVAIGPNAGLNNQPNNTIILNASTIALNGVTGQTGSFYVNPIRPATGSNALFYNDTTKEITYSSAITGPTGYTGYTGYTGPTGPTGSFSFTGPTGAVLFYNGTSVTGSSNLTYTNSNINLENNGAIIYNSSIKLTSDDTANSVAIGYQAGTNQLFSSVAIGPNAGYTGQKEYAIAIGDNAGNNSQGDSSIAIGVGAGYTGQKNYSIAIGVAAGGNNQGTSAVAIGPDAGYENQPDNTIILNAGDGPLNGATASSFYVNPIRGSVSTANALFYNDTSKEITYSSPLGLGFGQSYTDISLNAILPAVTTRPQNMSTNSIFITGTLNVTVPGNVYFICGPESNTTTRASGNLASVTGYFPVSLIVPPSYYYALYNFAENVSPTFFNDTVTVLS